MDTERKERIGIALFMAAVLAVCLFWQKDAGEKQADSFVTVRTKYYTGQGVVYGRDESGGYLVTAGHILKGLDEEDACTVIFADGRESAAEIYYQSDTADVAFLRVDEKSMPDTALPVKTDRKHFDALQEGDGLYIVILTGGGKTVEEGLLTAPWIYVEDFSLNMMLLKMNAAGGMSGGAVLDENGYFAGIVCGVSEEGEAAALPFSVIESEWMLAKLR